MRAVSCNSFGPLTNLQVVERDRLPLGSDEIRIAVTAAGVNFVDALFVQGLYQIKPPLPFVPGNEVAGVVSEVGADVTSLQVGQRAFTNVGLGGYASEVVVPAKRAALTPESMTDGQAATFTQSYSTAWFALAKRARVSAGMSMLVLGAGGGDQRGPPLAGGTDRVSTRAGRTCSPGSVRPQDRGQDGARSLTIRRHDTMGSEQITRASHICLPATWHRGSIRCCWRFAVRPTPMFRVATAWRVVHPTSSCMSNPTRSTHLRTSPITSASRRRVCPRATSSGDTTSRAAARCWGSEAARSTRTDRGRVACSIAGCSPRPASSPTATSRRSGSECAAGGSNR